MGIWVVVLTGLLSSVACDGVGSVSAESWAKAWRDVWNCGASMPCGSSPIVGEKKCTALFYCQALQPSLSVQIFWFSPTWK